VTAEGPLGAASRPVDPLGGIEATRTARGIAALDPDALTMAAIRAGALAGRPVTVLGFARSGIALARFLADAGARVTIHDQRPVGELAASVEALEGRAVTLVVGPDVDPVAALVGAHLLVASPSVNPDFNTTEPRLREALLAVRAARAGGDPTAPALVSEPDLFLRLCVAPTIGVTGTKGKTTTASLAAALLREELVHPVLLGGNIGIPLVEHLPDITAEHRVVYELSELQLPTLSRGTTVAVYTNVTSDHLDRHGTVAAYRGVKRRLAELADPDGAIVLNLEDPVSAAYAGLGITPAVLYRNDHPTPGGVGVVDGWIVAAGVERLPLAGGGVAATGPAGTIMPVAELGIPGRHNVSNALAAISVALLFGVAPDAIRRAAARFSGVRHRLETVAVVDGVRFVNDSMGTQPDAVIAALRAFDGPVILIAGGQDKGVEMDELAGVVAERASAVLLIGQSAPVLRERFAAAGQRWIEDLGELGPAVRRADHIARTLMTGEPDRAAVATSAAGAQRVTVLLSPAAASFDQFVDYAARGEAFRAAVAGLERERAGRAVEDGRR
jgi:UDP-N-acetylmuramoylalanine--D-glutamate ligase